MGYQPPKDEVAFRMAGAAYLSPHQPVANFRFDGKPQVFYAPPPGILKTAQSPWQAGNTTHHNLHSQYQQSTIVQTTRSQTSQQAQPRQPAPLGLLWDQVTTVQTRLQSSHGTGQPRSGTTNHQWTQISGKDNHQQSQWDKSIQAQDEVLAEQWNKSPETDSKTTGQFQSVDLYGATRKKTGGYHLPQPPLNFLFRASEYTPNTEPEAWFTFGSIPPNPAIQPRDSNQQSTYGSNSHNDQAIRLPWGFGNKARDENYQANYGGESSPDEPKKPEPEPPNIRESYLLMNTITTVTLPDRTPIELNDMDINLDIDSFSWSLSATLWGATSLALVEPDKDGAKQIEVDINGWTWVFIIERYTSNRQFGKERYTINGTSRTQLLAAPYAPQRNKSSGNNINAKQAISEELTNTGFTTRYPSLNEYTTPDWIIPGGSFSYQNETPIKVIVRMANTAGSVVIPGRDTDTLTIQPRYPDSPWGWDTATMDTIIPASMVISLSASWRAEPEYNAVYVSGTHTGVAVNVKRTGTAGNEPAPDILEDWLTETQVNTERGRNELAKGGHQSITTLEIPLTDTTSPPGLIEPGKLVEVQDIIGDWRGLCLGVGISVSGGKVTQSIELERHYNSESTPSSPTQPEQPQIINLIDSLGNDGASDWSQWDHWNNLYYWGSGNTQQEGTINGTICMIGKGTNTKFNPSYLFYYRTIAFELGKKYTASVWLKGATDTTAYINSFLNSYLGGSQHEVFTDKTIKGSHTTIKQDWNQYIWTFTCSEETPDDQGGVAFVLNKQPADVEIQWAMPTLAEGDLTAEEVQAAYVYKP